MSALPPKADILHCGKERPLFDHFVGGLLKVQGHVEAQSLGGPEIDDKLIFRWCLHRHVGRLLALEDAVDVAGRLPVLLDFVGSKEISPPLVTW